MGNQEIELVRSQYSGNEHGVVKGIGVVNGVYVNLDANEYGIIDGRIYDPEGDGKTKLDPVRDLFDEAIAQKNLPFRAVLMDAWSAAKDLMMHLGKAGKVFYCPLKTNRTIDDRQGENPYQAVADLAWFGDDMLRGKLVKIHGFPRDDQVKLFRVAAINRTEDLATNDLSQASAVAVKAMCGTRWNIEQDHREGQHKRVSRRAVSNGVPDAARPRSRDGLMPSAPRPSSLDSFSDHQVASPRSQMTRRTFGMPCSPPPDGALAPPCGGPPGPRPSGGHEQRPGLAATRLTFVFQQGSASRKARAARPAPRETTSVARYLPGTA